MTLLFVADHASAMVPHDIDLGIPAAWLGEHIAVDLALRRSPRRSRQTSGRRRSLPRCLGWSST